MRDPAGRRLLRESAAARPALLGIGALGVAAAVVIVVQARVFAGLLTHTRHLWPAAGGLAAAFAARALVLSGFELCGRLGALRVMSELRGRVMRRLLEEDPVGAPGERSGEIATVAVQGVDALEAWFARYLPQAILSAVIPPAILVYLVTVDATAAFVLAGTVPVLIVFMVLIGLAARAHTRARWSALSGLSAHFADVVRGLDTLRAHVRETAQQQVMADVSDRYRRATLGTLRVAFLSAFVLELVAMLGTALVAATVGLQLVAGHLDLHAGLTVLILAPELYAPLRAVGQQFHASEDGLAGAERLFAFLDRPVPVRGTLAAPDPAAAPIAVDRVSFAYPGRPGHVLHDVSFVVEPGETVALTGPSGAGKSTLAALLLGMRRPDRGTVRCGGTDLGEVDPAAWHARLAWIPQRPAIVAGTIADNVRLARPDASDDDVARALGRAGALELILALRAGIETRIGEGARPVSAGEAQRIALARAFVRDAPLVILDEPTAHLDPETAAEVEDALADLCRDRTAVWIVHRPELAARADRVVDLRDGTVLAPPLELAA